MTSAVALLTVPGSSLDASLRPRIEARGIACRALDLDAPLLGKPVTVGPHGVVWEGIDLLSVGALLVERPVFPWPQPLRIAGLPNDGDDRAAAIAAEREARALVVSAIRVAAETIPVVNPPWASYLAASPAVALDLAVRAGVRVVPWRLGPLRVAGADDLILDPVGGDRWHTPSRPPEGDPVLAVQAPVGPVAAMLVIGREVAAAIGYEGARAWAAGEPSREQPAWSGEPAVVDRALGGAEACGLPLAEVLVGADPRSGVVFINPAPDLISWGARTDGRVLDTLADDLVRRARHPALAARAGEVRR